MIGIAGSTLIITEHGSISIKEIYKYNKLLGVYCFNIINKKVCVRELINLFKSEENNERKTI